jgi:histidine phosphotransferase ChpT
MVVKVDMRVLELLASRLCHDLISPIGAIGNGLELLEEGGVGEDALKLSIGCARRATTLLEFFRMAYGAAGSQTPVGWEAAQGLAEGLLDDRKIKLIWSALPAGQQLPAGCGRLALNLVLLATEALPRGGDIAVGVERAASRTMLVVTATGRDARLVEEMQRAILREPVSTEMLTARTIHGYFTARVAESLGSGIDLSGALPNSVRFAVALPSD